MKAVCLFSGGKDSTLALHRAIGKGIDVSQLLTIAPENDYSYMFHKPNIRFTSLQAEALGIPQVIINIKGDKDEELADLESAIADSNADLVITGAIASQYQKSRVDAICDRLGIRDYSPLWGIEPLEELKELSKSFDVIITKVSADGMDKSLLGAHIDGDTIIKLLGIERRFHINLSFEGGEAESFVLNAPLFKKKIVIDKSHVENDRSNGEYIIDSAHLDDKI
ncbi:aEF-2-diphthamide synthase (DPH6) [Candidatus Mancarchaeum acidiphilum]|uniref:AEF-2-diphthamide synthase (DPH6) n=1 Tax=Candidatus Mancarchaeum acidiphilum TaxID=1920749 RepID=A0A218NNS7_9ARCH|nr:diphthine--ammonia ligase [Candidatus Mancarchaeum acidiphilum]ASI14103.1 aEF-2-diphthamide synthase (DPH6) [Candidatus Mancarchaeum acidiphilum]